MMKTAAKLAWLETKLFLREPFSMIFAFVFPLVVLVVIAGSFGSQPDPEFGGARPPDYYLASYIAVVVAAIGLLAVPVHLASYRERGVLRRFRASAVPWWAVLGAHGAVGLATAVVGAVVLMVAGTQIYGASLPSSALAALGGFVLGTVAFLALGFLLAGVTKRARATQAIGMILFFPMWLLSGAGPPPNVMGAGMRSVSDFLPLTHVVRALQSPWLGWETNTASLVVLAAITVVASLLSVRVLRTAPD
jgi:ABC-2 type transport system permease protein